MTGTKPGHASDGAVEKLSTAESWGLIEGDSLGRLALVDAAGEPQIYPVNYAVNEGVVFIRTANDSKLRSIRVRPVVALEVDGVEADERWSVVIRGAASQVETDAELRRSRSTGLRSLSPTPKPFVLRLEPTAVTGRRFRASASDRANEEMQVQALTTPADDAPAGARRPQAIPHFAPLAEE